MKKSKILKITKSEFDSSFKRVSHLLKCEISYQGMEQNIIVLKTENLQRFIEYLHHVFKSNENEE